MRISGSIWESSGLPTGLWRYGMIEVGRWSFRESRCRIFRKCTFGVGLGETTYSKAPTLALALG